MGVMLAVALWLDRGWAPVLVAMAVIPLLMQPPKAKVIVSLLLGLLTPIWVFGASQWLWDGRFEGPLEHVGTEHVPWFLLLFAPAVAAGWVLRQLSLNKATAQQRFSRSLTQWAGLVAVLAVLSSEALHGNESARDMLAPAFAIMATWSLGWCLPPRWRLSPVVTWGFLAMAIALAAHQAWL